MALEDVGVVDLFEDVDFRKEKLLQFLAFERVELDDLDGDYLI